jgi:CheY-like chemotaxis protein
MSRILLADDSPHAQRMGEYILREEGHEVVTVTDGETALVRLGDVDPDLILADVLLPQRSGYEICRYVKDHPKFPHTRVVLTAGALEPFDEEEARRVRADGSLRKPFEASAVIETVKPLLEAAELARKSAPHAPGAAEVTPPVTEFPVDVERVHAAVTLALDTALPAIVDEITQRVLVAFEKR